MATDETFLSVFDGLSDDARLWIFAARDAIPDCSLEALLADMREQLSGWKSHGTPVRSSFAVCCRRFILIAGEVQEPNGANSGPSGCAIDSLVRSVAGVVQGSGLELEDAASPVYFVEQSASVAAPDLETAVVRCVSRDEFSALCLSGKIGLATRVFNNSVSTLGELRNGLWCTSFSNSWHAQIFELSH